MKAKTKYSKAISVLLKSASKKYREIIDGGHAITLKIAIKLVVALAGAS